MNNFYKIRDFYKMTCINYQEDISNMIKTISNGDYIINVPNDILIQLEILQKVQEKMVNKNIKYTFFRNNIMMFI